MDEIARLGTSIKTHIEAVETIGEFHHPTHLALVILTTR